MKFNKLIVLLTLFVVSHSASAGWFEAKIATVHTYLNGGIAVFSATNHECGSNRLSFDNSAPGFQRVYSAILAYEAQGRTVRFEIDSCNGNIGVVSRVVSITE